MSNKESLVNLLMSERGDVLSKLETLKIKYDEDVKAVYTEASKVLNMAQELCEHPEERTEDDYDYHNNVSWTEYYCAVCNKYLRRE